MPRRSVPKTTFFTHHALTVMGERGIRQEWVERVLTAPEWTEADPNHPTLRRAFGRIPEFGDRMVRVVYHDREGERRVITAFADRTRRHGRRKGQP